MHFCKKKYKRKLGNFTSGSFRKFQVFPFDADIVSLSCKHNMHDKKFVCLTLKTLFGTFLYNSIRAKLATEGGGYLFNSSLPLPPASQTLRQSRDYCREITSANRQQLYSNQEPSVSERKSLTTKLRALFKTTIKVWIKKVLFNKW